MSENGANTSIPSVCSLWDGNPKTSGLMTPPFIGVYYVWFPILATIGISGNSISFLTILKQSRHNEVYILQMIVILTDLLNSITVCGYFPFLPTIMNSSPGPNWAKRSIVASYWTAYGSATIPNIFITASIMILLAMVFD